MYLPLNQILPLVNPNDILITGWDISKVNMGDAMKRAAVLDYNLIEKLYPEMRKFVPMPSIYYEDFIALN
jgi:myo-inositol-1-phosphate synthase